MYNIISQNGLVIESFDTLPTAQEYLKQALRKGSKPGYLRIEPEDSCSLRTLEYQVIWNNGQVDRYPADVYSLQDIRNLRNAITLATKGAYKGRIDLVEVGE